MSDLLHTHTTFGFAPRGVCGACDQTRAVFDGVAARERGVTS